MGGGKTTVITPLLALLLGCPAQLVVQCVPSALLQMSRAMTRSTFSSVIIKAVYTFAIDRRSSASQLDAVHARLVKARATSSIVVCSPTSLKAFLIKVLETFHEMSTLKAEEKASMLASAKAAMTSFRSRLAALSTRSPRQPRSLTSRERIVLMGETVAKCSAILEVFRGSALLLDEVDLVLHPLKSELNWPLGFKQPLDFTTSAERPGRRWSLAFFLLDALFYTRSGALSVEDIEPQHDPRVASLLAELRRVVEIGFEEQVLQATPHLLLLDRPWYHRHMKPLLASWLLRFVRLQRVRALDDAEVVAYLMRRERPASGALERAPDEQVKTLNLAHDWLNAYLPHVLSRTCRVHYGLLQPEDIQLALLENPRMPRNRRYLAVPFVGKDTPSRASEFSHPDVVIGCTILAYRYEGSRRSDLITALRALREQLSHESGPMSKRPASLVLYACVPCRTKQPRPPPDRVCRAAPHRAFATARLPRAFAKRAFATRAPSASACPAPTFRVHAGSEAVGRSDLPPLRQVCTTNAVAISRWQ